MKVITLGVMSANIRMQIKNKYVVMPPVFNRYYLIDGTNVLIPGTTQDDEDYKLYIVAKFMTTCVKPFVD